MAFYSDKDEALLLAVRRGNIKQVEKILESNGLTIDENWIDYTLLLTALQRDHRHIVELLLKMGCRVKRVPKSNVFNIPVYYAVRMGDANIVKKLLDRGASIYDRNGNEETPICLAMHDKEFSIVDMLLSMYDFDNINPSGRGDIVHFLIACKRNIPKVILNFVERGVSVNNFIDFNSIDSPGFTPLHIAVRNMSLETVEFLLSRGADITAKDSNQWTPLHLANQIRENQKPAGIETIIDSILSSHGIKYANSVNDKGVSHFHIACTRDNPKIVQHFLQYEVDINSCGPSNSSIFAFFTALHYAVYYNCIQVVELLLNHNADVNVKNKEGWTPLHLAATHGHSKIVEIILKHGKANLMSMNGDGLSPLHCAFYSEHKKDTIIDMLLQHVSKVINPTNYRALSHFHIACTRTNPTIVKEFLEHNVSINSCVDLGAPNFAGYSALHFAVQFNRKNIVQLLLEHNANVNFKEVSKLTPLHLACIQNLTKFYELIYKYKEELTNKSSPVINWKNNHEDQIEIVKLLLNCEVDVNSKDLTYRTPLFYAHGFRPKSIKKEIEKCLNMIVDITLEQIILKELNARRKEIINLLFNYNADVNIPDYKNRTMLYFVSEREEEIDNLVEMAELFLSKGANVNAADENCVTPLHLAVKYRATKLVEVFLNHNANVNCIETIKLTTPLHLATSGKYKSALKEIIKLLVGKGADVNARQIDGRTPLHIACLNKNYYAVYELLRYGADINIEDNEGGTALFYNFTMYGYGSKSSTRVELIRHIKKLKVIGFYISEKIKSLYIKLHQKDRSSNARAVDNDNYIFENKNDEFIIKCRDELEKMKLTKIDNYSSLYNILFKSPNEMVKHIKNDSLKRILIADDFEKHFPLYGYLLKLQYKKGVARSFILKPAKESLEYITGLGLPDSCSEQILNYLNTTNLKNLIKCKSITSSIKRKSCTTNTYTEDCKSLIKHQRFTKLYTSNTKVCDIP
jgi:ankyrin repeat protein